VILDGPLSLPVWWRILVAGPCETVCEGVAMPMNAQVPAQAVSVDRLRLSADAVRGADAADIFQPIGCGCFADDGE